MEKKPRVYVDNTRNRLLNRVGKPYGYVAPQPMPEPSRWSRRVRGLEPEAVAAPEVSSPEVPREAAVSLVASTLGSVSLVPDVSPAALEVSDETEEFVRSVTNETFENVEVSSPQLPGDFTGSPLAASSPRVALFLAISPVASISLGEIEEYMTAEDNTAVLESRADVQAPEVSMGITEPVVEVEAVTALEVASPVVERVVSLPKIALRLKGWLPRLVNCALQAFRY